MRKGYRGGRRRPRRVAAAVLPVVAVAAMAASVTAVMAGQGDDGERSIGLAAASRSASTPTGITPPAGDFYNYAPGTVEQGNTRHVFYCGNKSSGKVHDQIALSVGKKQADGRWTYSSPRVAFGPAQAPAWSNYHTCDPQVLRGKFAWNGHVYPWAIFFTGYGCKTQAAPCPESQESPNQLGVAFSDSLDAAPSGWKVFPNPLISYTKEFGRKCPAGDYCIGQPAATSVDGAGRLLLFYQGKGGFVRRDVNLSDMSRPVIGDSVVLPGAGLPAWLHNASVIYSPARDRFYMSYDGGKWFDDPMGPPVQTETVVASIEGGAIWSGQGTWRVEGTIGQAQTGHKFNHNSGIVHGPYGTTVSDALEVIHTIADSRTKSGGWGVWTYRLWRTTFTLS